MSNKTYTLAASFSRGTTEQSISYGNVRGDGPSRRGTGGSFGAGYGNRTRRSCLGSMGITTIRTPLERPSLAHRDSTRKLALDRRFPCWHVLLEPGDHARRVVDHCRELADAVPLLGVGEER